MFLKNLFRQPCIILAVIFLGAIALPARAQFTSKIIDLNGWATAVAKDASGNIYELRATTHATFNVNAQVLKYTNGTGSPTIVYNGTLIPDMNMAGYLLDYAFGLAVTSNGDIYATTTNQYADAPIFYGNIIKLTNNSGTYTASIFKAGTASIGAFQSLAVDASNNLYSVEYNIAADGGNGGSGAYEVVKYTATAGVPSAAASTIIYDKLSLAQFTSSETYGPLTGLAVDPTGNVYVDDGFVTSTNPPSDGGHITKLTKSGSTYTASLLTGGFAATGLATDASGNLYALTMATAPNYSLVEYTGGAGSPTTLNTGTFHLGGNFYPFGITVLSASNIFVTDGENGTNHGSLVQLIGPPTTQASNVNFTNVLNTSATVNWTNGNGSNRAVFIKQTNTGTPVPVNSTTYTPNTTVYNSGTQIGATGWYCIYNGTGTTTNITGLTLGQTYRLMVMEYNGPATGENYLQTTAANNPNNVTTVTTIGSINRVSAAFSNAPSVNYTVTFGGSVSTPLASNFSLTTTGTITGASVGAISGSGTTYNVAVNTGSGNGDITLNLANATGLVPGLSTALPFAGQTYTIDKIAPTISVSSPSVSLTKSGPIIYTVTYTDANFNASTLVPGNITLNATGNATGTLGVSIAANIATVTISGITGNGTLGISIGAGTASDLAGNTAPASAASAIFTVDNTAPTVVISSTASNPTYTTPIPVTVTFSESVTGFTAADISLNAGTVSNFSGSGSVYSFNITTAGFNTYTANIAAAGAVDLAGNNNIAAAAFNIVYAAVVPVQLISFTATSTNAGTVLLNWKTASEQNNDHYLLEQSTDGTLFKILCTVAAQGSGNSTIPTDYSFTDIHPSAGNNFYRLTQLDKDAVAKQLGIRMVRIGAKKDWAVYPNPAVKDLSIILPGDITGKQMISIFDAAGKLYYQKEMTPAAGVLAVHLDKAPPAGMYTVEVEGLGARVVVFGN